MERSCWFQGSMNSSRIRKQDNGESSKHIIQKHKFLRHSAYTHETDGDSVKCSVQCITYKIAICEEEKGILWQFNYMLMS